jgi:hypothetical protein
MSDSPVSYRLRYSAVEYSRRGGQMSSLLFSLAQQALIWEAEGKAVEQVHCHLSGDGDYMGIALVDSALPTVGEAAA